MCGSDNNQTQHWMEHANDLFNVFCGITSVIVNALVLFIAFRYVDFHVKLNQIYVVNMTVSDLTYALVYMSTKLFIECFPAWLCACYYILVWSSQIGSVFFLLFLNIDKFISLSIPLHYHMYVTERRVFWLWILFWMIPLSYSFFTYFGPYLVVVDPKIPCKIRLDPIYYSSVVIVFYIVPLSISALISIYIYVLAHKKTRWTGDHCQNESQVVERKKAKKLLLKRVFFVFSSTLWSTITILPYRLMYCIYIFVCYNTGGSQSTSLQANFSIPLEIGRRENFSDFSNSTKFDPKESGLSSMCQSDEISVLLYVLFCLPPLGAVGNPIITIVTQRFYRSRATKIWNVILKIFRIPKSNQDDAVDTTVMSYDHETGSVRRMATARKTNGTAVPLLVTVRRGTKPKDQGTVSETLCSNRAFQVL